MTSVILFEPQVLNEIQEKVSLVDLAHEYGEVQHAGRDEFKMCCLWHAESKPSLFLTDRVYFCHGCEAQGNIFTWIQEQEEGVESYADAVIFLAHKAGVEIQPLSTDEREALNEQESEEARQQELLRAAEKFYHKQLWKSERAQKYAGKRGFNKALVKEFKVGYAPGGVKLVKHLRETLDASTKELKELKLANKKGRDMLADRLVVPVRRYGRIVNLYGRAIDRDAEPAHMYTGKNSTPFNWSNARKSRKVVVVESIIDAINIMRLGHSATIAYFGTQGWKNLVNKGLNTLFKGSKIEEVILIPDHDPIPDPKPGRPAPVTGPGFARVLEMCHALGQTGRRTRVAILPLGSDPADFARSHTADDLAAALEGALSPIEFARETGQRPKQSLFEQNGSPDHLQFRSGQRNYIVESPSKTKRGVQANVELQREGRPAYNDRISFWSSNRRKDFAKESFPLTDDERTDVEQDLIDMGSQLKIWFEEREAALAELQEAEETDPEEEMSDDQRESALEFLRDPFLLKRIAEDIEQMGYTGEVTNKVLMYLVATSRKLKAPMHAIISSQSAAGKSAMVAAIIKLMPEEDVFELSRITRNAMFYLPQDGLKNKFVTMAERVGSEDADYSIRTMQSEQKLQLLTTFKNAETNEIETKIIEIDGPMSYCETTTDSDLNPENLTRAFLLTLDDGEKQTALIHKLQARRRTLAAMGEDLAEAEIKERHQNAQRLLKPIHIVIEFSELIQFPRKHVRTRRDFMRFLELIEAIAFLYQYQRDVKTHSSGVQYIEATMWDYEKAFQIAQRVFRQTLDEIPPKARELLIDIRNLLQDQLKDQAVLDGFDDPDEVSLGDLPFTIKEITEHNNWPARVVRQHMKHLTISEMVLIDESKGKAHIFKFNADPEDVDDPRTGSLLKPEELRERVEQRNTDENE